MGQWLGAGMQHRGCVHPMRSAPEGLDRQVGVRARPIVGGVEHHRACRYCGLKEPHRLLDRVRPSASSARRRGGHCEAQGGIAMRSKSGRASDARFGGRQDDSRNTLRGGGTQSRSLIQLRQRARCEPRSRSKAPTNKHGQHRGATTCTANLRSGRFRLLLRTSQPAGGDAGIGSIASGKPGRTVQSVQRRRCFRSRDVR